MKIERTRLTQVQLTLHIAELATLIAAARWAAEGAPGELPLEVVQQLRQVLETYDQLWRQLNTPV